MSRISVLSPLDPPTHILQNPRSSSSQRLRASTDLQLLLSDAVLSTSFAKVYSDDNLYRTWCTIWPIIGTAEGLDGQMGKNIVQCVGMTVGLLNNSLMIAECLNVMLTCVETCHAPVLIEVKTGKSKKNVDMSTEIQIAALGAIQMTIETLIQLSTPIVVIPPANHVINIPVLCKIAVNACLCTSKYNSSPLNNRTLIQTDRIIAIDMAQTTNRILAAIDACLKVEATYAAVLSIQPLANIQYRVTQESIAVSFVTSSKFVSMVDTLIGWVLDTNTPRKYNFIIPVLLTRFVGSWRVQIDFGIRLMDQLASHICKIAEDIDFNVKAGVEVICTDKLLILESLIFCVESVFSSIKQNCFGCNFTNSTNSTKFRFFCDSITRSTDAVLKIITAIFVTKLTDENSHFNICLFDACSASIALLQSMCYPCFNCLVKSNQDEASLCLCCVSILSHSEGIIYKFIWGMIASSLRIGNNFSVFSKLLPNLLIVSRQILNVIFRSENTFCMEECVVNCVPVFFSLRANISSNVSVTSISLLSMILNGSFGPALLRAGIFTLISEVKASNGVSIVDMDLIELVVSVIPRNECCEILVPHLLGLLLSDSFCMKLTVAKDKLFLFLYELRHYVTFWEPLPSQNKSIKSQLETVLQFCCQNNLTGFSLTDPEKMVNPLVYLQWIQYIASNCALFDCDKNLNLRVCGIILSVAAHSSSDIQLHSAETLATFTKKLNTNDDLIFKIIFLACIILQSHGESRIGKIYAKLADYISSSISISIDDLLIKELCELSSYFGVLNKYDYLLQLWKPALKPVSGCSDNMFFSNFIHWISPRSLDSLSERNFMNKLLDDCSNLCDAESISFSIQKLKNIDGSFNSECCKIIAINDLVSSNLSIYGFPKPSSLLTSLNAILVEWIENIQSLSHSFEPFCNYAGFVLLLERKCSIYCSVSSENAFFGKNAKLLESFFAKSLYKVFTASHSVSSNLLWNLYSDHCKDIHVARYWSYQQILRQFQEWQDPIAMLVSQNISRLVSKSKSNLVGHSIVRPMVLARPQILSKVDEFSFDDTISDSFKADVPTSSASFLSATACLRLFNHTILQYIDFIQLSCFSKDLSISSWIVLFLGSCSESEINNLEVGRKNSQTQVPINASFWTSWFPNFSYFNTFGSNLNFLSTNLLSSNNFKALISNEISLFGFPSFLPNLQSLLDCIEASCSKIVDGNSILNMREIIFFLSISACSFVFDKLENCSEYLRRGLLALSSLSLNDSFLSIYNRARKFLDKLYAEVSILTLMGDPINYANSDISLSFCKNLHCFQKLFKQIEEVGISHATLSESFVKLSNEFLLLSEKSLTSSKDDSLLYYNLCLSLGKILNKNIVDSSFIPSMNRLNPFSDFKQTFFESIYRGISCENSFGSMTFISKFFAYNDFSYYNLKLENWDINPGLIQGPDTAGWGSAFFSLDDPLKKLPFSLVMNIISIVRFKTVEWIKTECTSFEFPELLNEHLMLPSMLIRVSKILFNNQNYVNALSLLSDAKSIVPNLFASFGIPLTDDFLIVTAEIEFEEALQRSLVGQGQTLLLLLKYWLKFTYKFENIKNNVLLNRRIDFSRNLNSLLLKYLSIEADTNLPDDNSLYCDFLSKLSKNSEAPTAYYNVNDFSVGMVYETFLHNQYYNSNTSSDASWYWSTYCYAMLCSMRLPAFEKNYTLSNNTTALKNPLNLFVPFSFSFPQISYCHSENPDISNLATCSNSLAKSYYPVTFILEFFFQRFEQSCFTNFEKSQISMCFRSILSSNVERLFSLSPSEASILFTAQDLGTLWNKTRQILILFFSSYKEFISDVLVQILSYQLLSCSIHRYLSYIHWILTGLAADVDFILMDKQRSTASVSVIFRIVGVVKEFGFHILDKSPGNLLNIKNDALFCSSLVNFETFDSRDTEFNISYLISPLENDYFAVNSRDRVSVLLLSIPICYFECARDLILSFMCDESVPLSVLSFFSSLVYSMAATDVSSSLSSSLCYSLVVMINNMKEMLSSNVVSTNVEDSAIPLGNLERLLNSLCLDVTFLNVYNNCKFIIGELNRLAFLPHDLWFSKLHKGLNDGHTKVVSSWVIDWVSRCKLMAQEDIEPDVIVADMVEHRKDSTEIKLSRGRSKVFKKKDINDANELNLSTLSIKSPDDISDNEWIQQYFLVFSPLIMQLVVLASVTLDKHVCEDFVSHSSFKVFEFSRQHTAWISGASNNLNTKFRQKFAPRILNLIASLYTPPIDELRKGSTLYPGSTLPARMKQWLDSLIDTIPEFQYSFDSNFSLCDSSPSLVRMNCNEKIKLPGMDGFIVSISSAVCTLNTKTKPKKLSILNSIGSECFFLLKSNEDMRLDSKLMSILKLSNELNSKSNQYSSFKNSEDYRIGSCIRTYDVLPLSIRAGLIQWVPNSVPLIDLYKHWQNREKPQDNTPQILFLNKINEHLISLGLPVSTPRVEWPDTMMQRVFIELQGQVPADLVKRELSAISESPRKYFQVISRFTKSLASSNILGYLLGLGDRHLGNILFDKNSGEVVHIDYAVCFDRGVRLKIPEMVPFRLSSIFYAALGPTGLNPESEYRKCSEYLLFVLRQNSGCILNLLSSFISNPVVIESSSMKNSLNNNHHFMDSVQAGLSSLDVFGFLSFLRFKVFQIPFHETRLKPSEYFDMKRFKPFLTHFSSFEPICLDLDEWYLSYNLLASEKQIKIDEITNLENKLLNVNKERGSVDKMLENLYSNQLFDLSLQDTFSQILHLSEKFEAKFLNILTDLNSSTERHSRGLKLLFDESSFLMDLSLGSNIENIIEPSYLISVCSGSIYEFSKNLLNSDIILFNTVLALSFPEDVLSAASRSILPWNTMYKASIPTLLDTLTLADVQMFSLEQKIENISRITSKNLLFLKAILNEYVEFVCGKNVDHVARVLVAGSLSDIWKNYFKSLQDFSIDPNSILSAACLNATFSEDVNNKNFAQFIVELQHESMKKDAKSRLENFDSLQSETVEIFQKLYNDIMSCIIKLSKNYADMANLFSEWHLAISVQSQYENILFYELTNEANARCLGVSAADSITSSKLDLIRSFVDNNLSKNSEVLSLKLMPWYGFMENILRKCSERRKKWQIRSSVNNVLMTLTSELLEFATFFQPVVLNSESEFRVTPFVCSFITKIRLVLDECSFLNYSKLISSLPSRSNLKASLVLYKNILQAELEKKVLEEEKDTGVSENSRLLADISEYNNRISKMENYVILKVKPLAMSLLKLISSNWKNIRSLIVNVLKFCPFSSSLYMILSQLKDDTDHLFLVCNTISGTFSVSEWLKLLIDSLGNLFARCCCNWKLLYRLDNLYPFIIKSKNQLVENWPCDVTMEHSVVKSHDAASSYLIAPNFSVSEFSGLPKLPRVNYPSNSFNSLNLLSSKEFAMHCWFRVRDKLIGQDAALFIKTAAFHNNSTISLDSDGILIAGIKTKLSVKKHVDYLIHQATSIDVLSQLYEGWAAWI